MREWFIVGAKLLGIYFLYWALTTLPSSIMVSMSFSSKSVILNEGPSNLVIFLASISSGLVMIGFAYMLLFKTELIADKLKITDGLQPRHNGVNLQAGITLIGIYIFVSKVGRVVDIFATAQKANRINNPFAASQPQGFAFSSKLIEPGFTILISLCLIFGSKYIAAFLTKNKLTATEQLNRGDRE
jgi:hypothetical protein